MVQQIRWLDRTFTFDQPLGVFPLLLERLRGTPVRALELVGNTSEEFLSTRIDGKWSVKEHIGHLVDLQFLDEKRLSEFLAHIPALSAADMENRATENANHRQTVIADILDRLRSGRQEFVSKLEALREEQVAITSIHPRLKKPMRLLDWSYFLAEHDDHHLARARQAIATLNNNVTF